MQRLREMARAARQGRVLPALLAGLTGLLLSGCGSSAAPTATTIGETSPPAPFTHEQKLDEKGGGLFIADGCSACHQISKKGIGPSLDSLVARRVRLADGRRVLVDEGFLREALEDPRKDELAGYPPQLMLQALRQHHLSGSEAAALAAFIEELGPETEPE